jgi:hemolysin activation/secretion protein
MRSLRKLLTTSICTVFVISCIFSSENSPLSADAGTSAVSVEQSRIQEEIQQKRAAAKVQSPKADPEIEIGPPPSDAQTSVLTGAPDRVPSAQRAPSEQVFDTVSPLSEASEELTLIIQEIRIPDDAPISRYEMEALISSFEGKEIKLSQLIYLTDNITQLYASARLVSNLHSLKEGFDEEDLEGHTPTSFIISRINVPFNAAISQEEVEELVKPYEGKELTLAELRSFAKNVDRIYMASENITMLADGTYTPFYGTGAAGTGGTARGRASWKSGATGSRMSGGAAAGGLPVQDVPFLIRKVEFTGNTMVSSEEIRKIVESYEGKEMKLSEAKAIAMAITQAYRSRGFITCRAYIPPQKLSEGVLKIQILEGKLGKISVKGNRFFSKQLLKRYLDQHQGKVLEYDKLKRDLSTLNLHPDREVKAVIIPGKTLGTSDLVLEVKDQNPLHIGAEINNFGTRVTGRERYIISARHTNLLGIDDIFAARVQFGDEVFAVGSQYVVPVGEYQTQVGTSVNYTDVTVGKEFGILDLGGQAFASSFFINQPIYKWRNLDFTLTGSFEYKDIENTVLGSTSSKDELRILHAGFNIEEVDQWGRTFIINDFAFGTPWFGASDSNDPNLSRADAEPAFFKYTLSANRIHPVYDYTYLLMKGNAQFTPDDLLPSEQFDIGGVYSVRGYPQSDYLGDYGVGGSIELRVPWYFIPKEVKAPWSDQPLWNRINFVGFVDAAHAELRAPAVGEFKSRNYVGLGAGVRFDLPKNWVGRFEYGFPVGDDPVDGSNSQFYFSISGDFM